jgi:hypothetical protein
LVTGKTFAMEAMGFGKVSAGLVEPSFFSSAGNVTSGFGDALGADWLVRAFPLPERSLKCATNRCSVEAIALISLAALADSSAAAVFC